MPTLEPSSDCQRGLRWTLARLELPHEQVCARLAAAFPQAVRDRERWGTREVERLIVQFRVEFRVGERPGEVALLFRTCCPLAEREAILERVLALSSP
ncbi:hypothetical protein ACNOYE_19170 [Nannocystaceae bacterium ST9]